MDNDFTWMDDVTPLPIELLKVGDIVMFKWWGSLMRFEITSMGDEIIDLVHGYNRYTYHMERDMMVDWIEKGKIQKKCGLSYTTNLNRWV